MHLSRTATARQCLPDHSHPIIVGTNAHLSRTATARQRLHDHSHTHSLSLSLSVPDEEVAEMNSQGAPWAPYIYKIYPAGITDDPGGPRRENENPGGSRRENKNPGGPRRENENPDGNLKGYQVTSTAYFIHM